MPEKCYECQFSSQAYAGSLFRCFVLNEICEKVLIKRNDKCPLKLIDNKGE